VLRRPIETTGIITTYLSLRLLVGSGFINTYPTRLIGRWVPGVFIAGGNPQRWRKCSKITKAPKIGASTVWIINLL